MKRKNAISLFIISIILLCQAIAASAEEKNWYKSLLKFFQPDKARVTEITLSFDRNQGRKETQRLALENINEHFMEVARLRAMGKTEEEILRQFSSMITAKGTGSISGAAYENDGVTPVQHYVSVWAFNEYGQYCGYDSIMSQDNGAYKVSDLAPGKYYVRASGYSYKDEYYKNAADWRKAKLVRVKKGKEKKRIDFILDPYDPYIDRGEGGISGQVCGVDGIPVSDCLISAFDEGYNLINSSLTDANGFYVVSDLPSDDYKLYASYRGHDNYVGEWYNDAQSFETATFVTVTEPETTDNIDFILDFGGIIKGIILGADGRRVGAYECFIAAYDDEKNWIESETTDEKGRFSIAKLKEGVYRLRIMYYGQENFLDCWYKGAQDFESASPIPVKPGRTKTVRIKLEEGGAISGRVYDHTGAPAAAYCCRVEVYDEHMDYIESEGVDDDGCYTVMRLPTGRYKLFADFHGFASYRLGEEPASEWYDGQYDFGEASFVKVTAGRITKNIDFSLEKGGYIGGRVYDQEGRPLSYCGTVEAYNRHKKTVGLTRGIANDGLYYVEGLPTGEYKLKVSYEGEGNYKDEWYNEKQNFETADYVNVQAPQGKYNIDFTLEYPGILQGFVIDSARNRLSEDEFILQMYAYDAITGAYVSFEENSFTGGYQFELLGGKYKLAAVNFYYNWMLNHTNLAAAFYKDSANFTSAKSISLKPNTTTKLRDLVMERAEGVISGTVYDEINGQPLAEGLYMIFAFDEEGYLVRISGYSHCNGPITGEYQLRGLRPGNYYLLALAATEDIADVNVPFQWYDGIDANIDLLTFTPKVDIPINTTPVTANEGETTGIDFYFNFSDASGKGKN